MRELLSAQRAVMSFIEKVHGSMHAPIAKDMATSVHSRFVQQLEADGAREGGEVAHSCASL